MTLGEKIDALNICDIIKRDDFVSLVIEHGFPNPTYWEITLKAKREKDGKLVNMFGNEVQHPLYKFYKIKL